MLLQVHSYTPLAVAWSRSVVLLYTAEGGKSCSSSGRGAAREHTCFWHRGITCCKRSFAAASAASSVFLDSTCVLAAHTLDAARKLPCRNESSVAWRFESGIAVLA
jgi:hypothetical protein